MTTSRMVVVLRSELGLQLSLAQKEKKVLEDKYAERIKDYSEGRQWKESERKEWMRASTKCRRLENAAHALGAIQLGDIEDKEL